MNKNNDICSRAAGFFSKSEKEVYLKVVAKSITLIICTKHRSKLGHDEATK
jgi:hypothetical protein